MQLKSHKEFLFISFLFSFVFLFVALYNNQCECVVDTKSANRFYVVQKYKCIENIFYLNLVIYFCIVNVALRSNVIFYLNESRKKLLNEKNNIFTLKSIFLAIYTKVKVKYTKNYVMSYPNDEYGKTYANTLFIIIKKKKICNCMK